MTTEQMKHDIIREMRRRKDFMLFFRDIGSYYNREFHCWVHDENLSATELATIAAKFCDDHKTFDNEEIANERIRITGKGNHHYKISQHRTDEQRGLAMARQEELLA